MDDRSKSLGRSELHHVAELAELSLTEEEEIRLTKEIGGIVAYFAELDAIDTTHVPPTAHVTAQPDTPLRLDEPRPCLTQEEALSGAPKAAHGGFVVPTFVE